MGNLPAPETLRLSIPAPPSPLTSPAETRTSPQPSGRIDVLRHFDRVFSETPATKAEDIEEAFRLRYQVYCLDRHFEAADSCPSGMERDHYDDLAVHCLLKSRSNRKPIGTVRLVLPPATPTWFTGLPLAKYALEDSIQEIMRLPAGTTAEVSRFAITRAAREILRDAPQPDQGLDGPCAEQRISDKLLPYMSLGLIRGLIRLSVLNGVTHWCLAAEPCLLRRLRSFGLHFKPAGSLVEHRGLRQVCYAKLEELLVRAKAEQPEIWDVLTVGGFLTSGELAQNAA